MRLVHAACCASFLTGCGLLELGSLVDGLGGASSSSASTTAASSSSGAPPRFCDDVTATRCFDFDAPDPLAAFTFVEYATDTESEHGVSSLAAASAPNAMWVRFTGAMSPAGATHVTKLDGAPTHAVLEWDIRRETEELSAENVLSMTWRRDTHECQIGVMLSESTPRVQFYHQRYDVSGGGTLPLADATTELDLDTTIDAWLHLTLEVTLSPGSSSIVLTGEGGVARNDAVAESDCESPPDPGTMTFAFGPTYNQAALEVFYDNVVIRAD